MMNQRHSYQRNDSYTPRTSQSTNSNSTIRSPSSPTLTLQSPSSFHSSTPPSSTFSASSSFSPPAHPKQQSHRSNLTSPTLPNSPLLTPKLPSLFTPHTHNSSHNPTLMKPACKSPLSLSELIRIPSPQTPSCLSSPSSAHFSFNAPPQTVPVHKDTSSPPSTPLNTSFHRLALELSLPETNVALNSSLQHLEEEEDYQRQKSFHYMQKMPSIPGEDNFFTESSQQQSPRSPLPPLDLSLPSNSPTYCMHHLSNLPSPPTSSNSVLRIKKCPSAGSRQSTVKTSKSKKKKAHSSDKLNAASFDSIPAILPKFSRSSQIHLSPSLLDSRSPPSRQPDTLATFYMVCGLPKNPQCWTLAQPDYLPSHLPGALPRFWRPEVLGTTVSGQETLPSLSNDTETIHNLETYSESSISKEELSKIQTKAIKLAFAREVEVIASSVQPPSTTHCFSFTTQGPSCDSHDGSGSLPHQWDFSLASSSASTNRQRAEKTYYAACLQVWSHSDKSRADAIRRSLEEGPKAKSIAVVQAIKASAAGRRLGSKLQKAVSSPMGLLTPSAEITANGAPRTSRLSAYSGVASTDTEDAEGFFSDSEWETGTELVNDNIAHRLLNDPKSDNTTETLHVNTPLWLPYCLVLISKFPLYDLMVDHLKISWARYHNSIYKHSLEMLRMLNFPLPKSSSVIKLPVGSSKESTTKFIAKLPGISDLSNGGLEEVNFTMWPLFKCLSLRSIISIYEVGLSPMGRIVFFSNHPPILNIAVESIKLLLELRGWVGLSQSIVHSRDFKIYLEDPGPFILGANSQLRHIADDISPEIMVVDLDTDTINCPKPHPDAISKGQVRMKIEKKLYSLLGSLPGMKSVPVELQEAFPAGRFRPFSAVEIKDQLSDAERFLPPPEWNWSQTGTVIAFDDVMSKMPNKGIAKILKRKTNRQAAVLDSSALHVQEIIRKHTVRFVDRRDMLEAKIWKLNRRLAFLMSESMEWKQHFDSFQKFTDILSTESQALKTRLELERREHRTLTGVVAEQKSRQVELENRLLETEKAWMAAQVELAKAQEIREELQRQKEFMVSEMKAIALGKEDETMVDQIVPRRGSFIGLGRGSSMRHNQQISLTTKNLRRLSAQAQLTSSSPLRSSSQLEPHEESAFETDPCLDQLGSTEAPHNVLGAESDSETIPDDTSALSESPEDDERALLSRSAVVETMRSIQNRLEAALRTAGQLDEEELKGYEVSPFSKSALSRISTDSQGSKVIPLRRGRRKPLSGINLESETTSTSMSTSPAPNTPHPDSQSVSVNSPSEVPLSANRRSNRPTESSVVSLLLPGSSIFSERLSLSLGTSKFSSASTCNSHEAVKDDDSGDDDDNDDSRSGDGYSCDDGASFVSANDHSENPRRISTDSHFLPSLNSDISSPPQSLDHSLATSRVSILGASPATPANHDASAPSPNMSRPSAIKMVKSSSLIAFPTSPSELDEEAEEGEFEIQKYLDRRDGTLEPAAARSQGESLAKHFDMASPLSALENVHETNGILLRSPLDFSHGISHRGSFVSNCSSVATVKNVVSSHGPLARSPLVPARTLHRQSRASHTSIKPASPAPHRASLKAELVDFPLENIRLKLGSIQSSRRLRSTPSPTSPVPPSADRQSNDPSS